MIAVISWVEKSRRGIERVTASYRVEQAGPRLKRLGSVQTYFIAVCPWTSRWVSSQWEGEPASQCSLTVLGTKGFCTLGIKFYRLR